MVATATNFAKQKALAQAGAFCFNGEVRIQLPKSDAKYHWTNHVTQKMMYYGLSADRVKRVMRNPHRIEKGIAPDTIAVMQPGKTLAAKAGKPASWKEEIWVMYAVKASSPKMKTENWKLKTETLLPRKRVIITAWRYPGKSPVREAIPIPNDILEELKSIKY